MVLREENLFFLSETDSTNRLAAAYAAEHPGVDAVFVAGRQTAGEGRLGRRFESPAGAGLYMTILLHPTLPPADVLRLTTCAAIAVRRAIFALCGRAPDVKWVNDLWFDGKKAAGILAKGVLSPDGKTLAYALLGIGVNLTPAVLPPEVAAVATSLAEATGVAPTAKALAEAILRELPDESGYASPALLSEYRAASCLIGRDVTVFHGAETYPARVLDVTEEAALRVLRADGTVEDLSSGEVSVRPQG